MASAPRGRKKERRIRAIFLQRRSRYSFSTAVRLLGMTAATLRAEIDEGRVEAERNADGSFGLTWSQLAFVAMQRWTLLTIAEELGQDIGRGLPELVQPLSLTVCLPKYQVKVLFALARRRGVDVDTFLADHLFDLCESHAAELIDEIPDLVEAIAFPDSVEGVGAL